MNATWVLSGANAAIINSTGRRKVKFTCCLPAFNDPNPTVDPRHYTGITGGPEATDGVFESGASIVPDQAENRLCAIRASLVAMCGGLLTDH